MKQEIVGVIDAPDGEIPAEVQHMIDNPGLYIGYEKGTKNFVPLLSMGGIIYSMRVDSALNPKRFVNGTTIAGPLKPD